MRLASTVMIVVTVLIAATVRSGSLELVEGYDKLAKPEMRKVEEFCYDVDDKRLDGWHKRACSLHFQGVKFESVNYPDDNSNSNQKMILSRDGEKLAEVDFGTYYATWGDVRVFDADQNGLDDIFFAYFWGPKSLATTFVIQAYFFFPDSTIRYAELSTDLGTYEYFADFTGDGRWEFMSVSQEYCYLDSAQVQRSVCVTANLFSMTDGLFENVSDRVEGFPMVSSYGKVLESVPPGWDLRRDRPSVQDYDSLPTFIIDLYPDSSK